MAANPEQLRRPVQPGQAAPEARAGWPRRRRGSRPRSMPGRSSPRAISTWPRRCSTRATSTGAETGGAGPGSRKRPDPSIAPLGHYVLADVYSRRAARTKRPARWPGPARWSVADEWLHVGRSFSSAHRRLRRAALHWLPRSWSRSSPGSRLAADRRRRRPGRAADATSSDHRHHRHAARRPARRLRQHHGADAQLRPARRARACGRVDATAHVPITRPSHATLFTARYPAEHGVRDNISLPLAKDVPTLAEALAAQGFATAAFVSSFVLSSPSGLDRGFGHYDDAFDVPQRDEAVTHQHSPAAWRRDPRQARAVAGRAQSRDARQAHRALGAPLRPSRPVRTTGAVCHAVRRPPLRRRGGVDRHAARPAPRQPRGRGSSGTKRWSS